MENMVEKEAMEIIDFWRDLYKPKKAQESLPLRERGLNSKRKRRRRRSPCRSAKMEEKAVHNWPSPRKTDLAAAILFHL